MIEIINVKKGYKGIELFHDVNIVIPNGKKVFIKGSNGSGKSVFLKLISGFAKVDEGEILVDGQKVGKEIDFIQNAGISINSPEFIHNISGLANLMELAKIKKIATKESILKWCSDFDLVNDIQKKYGTYSLGMKQKMRIIQALMDNPKYLILDEPFDALDNVSKLRLVDILDKFLEENPERTIIYTSHTEDFENHADIIFEINDKRISQIK